MCARFGLKQMMGCLDEMDFGMCCGGILMRWIGGDVQFNYYVAIGMMDRPK